MSTAPDPPFTVLAVRGGEDLAAAVALFRAYAASLPIDLGYQGFEAEMAGMPGKYAPPAGELLLARGRDGAALGCVALRPFAPDGTCEMKRLYVVPEARRLGVGEALVAAVLAAARRIGYRAMLLDTLPSMTGALALYARHGFTTTEAYYDTPVAGTIFLEKDLAAGA
ncbi:GNAT family N-acetyltransferase [Prosthecomicrobium sp. N25]|uniref:GNAT family N-acetyltransferase n=1 Tax=Prosthecomicrobium sp. N25 TaxID=3129254 RepID=UPI0030778C89